MYSSYRFIPFGLFGQHLAYRHTCGQSDCPTKGKQCLHITPKCSNFRKRLACVRYAAVVSWVALQPWPTSVRKRLSGVGYAGVASFWCLMRLCLLPAWKDTLWLWMQRCTIVPSDCTHDPVLLRSRSRRYVSCVSHPDASMMGLHFLSHLGMLRRSVLRIRHSPQNILHLATSFVDAW